MLPGTKAPAFSAMAYNCKTKELFITKIADFLGSYTILLFSAGDFQSNLLTELEGMTKNADSQINLVYISTDSIESHQAFASQYGRIPLVMLTDKTGRICKEFQAYDKSTHMALPAWVVVDPEGEVVSWSVSSPGLGVATSEAVYIVLACQQCDVEGAWSSLRGTPSDWQPGMDLITELVEEVQEDTSANENAPKENNEDK